MVFFWLYLVHFYALNKILSAHEKLRRMLNLFFQLK